MSSMSDDDWFDRELLHRASQSGQIDEVRRLVEQGSDVNAFDELGMTPLHYAAEREQFDVVTFLLTHGANVNAIHEPTIGRPPLAHIAPTCSLRMAHMLLERGADPMLQIGLCRTALDKAKERKRGEGPLVYALFLDAVKRRRNPSR
jgi:ankyrin repeat protein